MMASVWGDIWNVVKPAVTPFGIGKSFIHEGQQVGQSPAATAVGHWATSNLPGAPSTSTAAPGSSDPTSAAGIISGLQYGQEYGTGTAAQKTAQQLAASLSSMPAADAQKLMTKLSGTPLGTAVSNILSGKPAYPNPNAPQQYGIDPLNLGSIFSSTIAPWLAQQQKQSDAGMSNLAGQMQSALKGASPAIAQAYSAAIPEMQAAQKQANQAATSAVATAPEWDRFLAQLSQAQAAAKAAQEAYYYQQAASGQTPIPGVTAPPLGTK